MGKYSLVGVDGNAFFIMGYVKGAMKQAFRVTGNPRFNSDAEEKYFKEATSGDYNYLIATSMDMINAVNIALDLH